jgi:long-chain fatty acid transport protein
MSNEMMRERGLMVVLVCGVAMMGYANGFRNPPEGGAALGKLGGKVALSDDAAAVAHNPANLTELKEAEVQASVTLINTETKYSSPMGSATTEDAWKYLPNLFYASPIKDTRYAVGFGVTTPFGQSTVWDKESVFRYSAPYFAEMKTINMNPTLAAKVNDKVSVAAGLDVYWSSLDLKQVFPWKMVTKNPMSPDGEVRMQGSGVGIGGNAAVTFRPAPCHIVALTYRSPVTVDYEGDTDFTGFPPGAEAMGISAESDFDASIEFPAVAALGYAVKITDTVRVEVDVEWVQFSKYDELSLDAGQNNPLIQRPGSVNPMAPVVVPQKWDDTWTYGLGAEWDVRSDLTLRAGYIFLESPVPEETLAPTLPDADRHVISVGAGLHRNGHRLDVAYGYSVIGDRDISPEKNPAYAGTYETRSHLMSVSYGYSF